MNRREFLRLTGQIGIVAGLSMAGLACGNEKSTQKIMALPYPEDALTPYLSKRTLYFHYEKHHQKYLENTKKMIAGTPYADLSIAEIVKKTADDKNSLSLHQQAAQVFNHDFFWQSMRPNGGGRPSAKIGRMMDDAFGGYEKYSQQFISAAVALFGSGWLWLVQDANKLRLVALSNAGTPITQGLIPLISLDLWEHAYYLDYQNRREEYAKAFLEHLVNWEFAEKNLKI